MQTKFILYGGFNPAEATPDNGNFSQEILSGAPEDARVLIVPFAKETERILPTAKRVTNELNASKRQKNIFTEIADEKNFTRQLESADVVYFQGGSSSKLLEALKQYPDLGHLLEGKIVAGDSGGGNVLCKFFYSPRTDEISEGFGILPLKMIPHYKEDYADKFDGIGPNLESVLLPEYAYRVFYR